MYVFISHISEHLLTQIRPAISIKYINIYMGRKLFALDFKVLC